MKKHADYQYDLKKFGKAVADYNAGFTAGWKKGRQDAARQVKAFSKLLSKANK